MAAVAPLNFTEDYKPAPLQQQIEAVTRAFWQVGDDERRGRIHPDVAALRRWELKSAVYTLRQVQQQKLSTTAPQAQPAAARTTQ